MTVRELRQMLSGMPDDMPVMISRGDWGPSRADIAREATVYDSGDRVHNWEVMFPEIEDDPGERPRLKVLLID